MPKTPSRMQIRVGSSRRKLVDYTIILTGDSVSLRNMVNDHITQGYEPLGAASIASCYDSDEFRVDLTFTQTMVKYEEPKKKAEPGK